MMLGDPSEAIIVEIRAEPLSTKVGLMPGNIEVVGLLLGIKVEDKTTLLAELVKVWGMVEIVISDKPVVVEFVANEGNIE